MSVNWWLFNNLIVLTGHRPVNGYFRIWIVLYPHPELDVGYKHPWIQTDIG